MKDLQRVKEDGKNYDKIQETEIEKEM